MFGALTPYPGRMPAARVLAVAPGSPAQRAGIATGDEILTVNGEQLRDVIAYQIPGRRRRGRPRSAAGRPRAAARRAQGRRRAARRSSSRTRSSTGCRPATTTARSASSTSSRRGCAAASTCRTTTSGSRFSTETSRRSPASPRPTSSGSITEKLSPLYVSIHATDPEVRTRLLRNRRGRDEPALARAAARRRRRGARPGRRVPRASTTARCSTTRCSACSTASRSSRRVGVVPLGVSAHSHEPEMRPHTADGGERGRRHRARVAGAVRRTRSAAGSCSPPTSTTCSPARPFPPLDAYDDCLQHENGIGMARTFEAEVAAALAGADVEPTGTRSGFFAAVDGAPAEGYRAPRDPARPSSATRSRAGDARARSAIVTGELGARVLAPLRARARRARRASRCGSFPSRTGSSAATSASPACSPAPTSPPRSRTSPPATATCSPTSCCRAASSSTARRVAVLPRPVEIVATDGAALVRARSREVAS